ncbi:hypothetical protein UFOVP1095_34 [uncultured Caudovirales phage]|uniref:Uncharacterized protein n=1 Tax=uncultured Caudovirales phage TaxID=2100421 RepID=A0A6J7XE57_9CAUD|nr:hypothetical protein UFOVP918_34 [uncultured Caudovirales phage]CAB4182685.1 hypothetical protein UFOVP1095_34 [uncultured Caudovirales phage]CAB4214231.1 hypothetical protein UFOVP1452_34 [uncultured Caudovirales phage]CAB5228308.1 hypothetical protein UFOVP1540_11 [uncultured Caudovirales phage]
MLFGILFSSAWVASRIEKFFNWPGATIVIKPIFCSAAYFARSISSAINIRILFCKFMFPFAMRFVSHVLRVSCHRFRKRFFESTIKHLFASTSPPAIFWRVISVVVDSIQSVMRWAFFHISNKGFETSASRNNTSPPFANSYSPSPPMFIVWSIWVGTSLDHVCPSVVKRLLCFVSHFWRSFNSINYITVNMGNCHGV